LPSHLIKKKLFNKLNFLLLNKLNFLLLKSGKNNVTLKIILLIIKNFKNNKNHFENRAFLIFFEKILNNILYRFILKKRMKGKSRQDIPVPIYKDEILYSYTIRNLLVFLKKNKGSSLDGLFITESMNIFNNSGQVKRNMLATNKLVILNRKLIK